MNLNPSENKRRIFTVKNILIALIVLYPLCGAFFGLDLGDTGYHLYAYTHFFSHPEKINYTTFFSSAIGSVWNLCFGRFGLIAFNFLEVFLEWGASFIAWRTLRKELGDVPVLIGCLFAVISADTYLNIFNYHQLNAFLLLAILSLELAAMTKDRLRDSLLAGILFTVLVFSRVGSVTAVVTLFLYVWHSCVNDFPWKRCGRHLLMCVAGAAISAAVFAAGLLISGRMTYFINNIFRLKDVAGDSSGNYGMRMLLSSLVKDNIKVITCALLFFGGAVILFFGINMILVYAEKRAKKVMYVIFGLAVTAIALYFMRKGFNIIPAENWPQMTTGPKFVLGIMYFVTFFAFIAHAFKPDPVSQKITLSIGASLMLIILTIAGSNTGTKHIVLALWLIAPIFVYSVFGFFRQDSLIRAIRRLFAKIGFGLHPWTPWITVFLAALMFFFKFGDMVYYTFNYDDFRRTTLTAQVDHPLVRHIFTTKREADAVNGVLQTIGAEAESEDQPLFIFGNSLLLYYLTGREAYGSPWATQLSLPAEKFAAQLESAAQEFDGQLPLIVYCKTNYAYGFTVEFLDVFQRWEKEELYGGKKDMVYDFMENHAYRTVYEDDYYAVLVPGGGTEFADIYEMMYGDGTETADEESGV